jgi:hypothetical protein
LADLKIEVVRAAVPHVGGWQQSFRSLQGQVAGNRQQEDRHLPDHGSPFITAGAIMKRMLLLCFVAVLIAPMSSAADDARVVRLEQDVRTLQRDLQNLARQVDQLRLQSSRPSPGARPPAPPPVETGPTWLDAARWKKLRPGMSELDVLGTLGPPTSVREQEGGRELL